MKSVNALLKLANHNAWMCNTVIQFLLGLVNSNRLLKRGFEPLTQIYLEAATAIGQFSDAIKHLVDELLADRVVATGIVVRRVLLARDQLLRVEELPVLSRAHLVDHRSLQVHEDRTRNKLSRPRFGKESGQVVVRVGLGEATVRIDSVFEAVKLPARVADLGSGLPDMKRNNFAHFHKK